MNIMIGRKTAATCINFGGSIGDSDPLDDMLEHTLIQLMKDIRCDKLIDVRIRQISPEGIWNSFDMCVFAGLVKCSISMLNFINASKIGWISRGG